MDNYWLDKTERDAQDAIMAAKSLVRTARIARPVMADFRDAHGLDTSAEAEMARAAKIMREASEEIDMLISGLREHGRSAA